MTKPATFTFHTRLSVTPEQSKALDAYAELHGRAQRKLHAALCAGRPLNELKREFLSRFRLSSRQFNALRADLDGKRRSIIERRPGLIAELETRIRRAKAVIAKLARTAPGSSKLHQKRRRLATLQSRLAGMKADEAAGAVPLCFGSRKLFGAQFALRENGFASHAEWRAAWRAARSGEIFVLGSKDEACGNQTAQMSLGLDSALTLRLRLPDGVEDSLKAAAGSALGSAAETAEGRPPPPRHLTFTGLRFTYGQERILAALANSRRVQKPPSKTGKVWSGYQGTAVSYRLQRDEKGWRLFASLEVAAPESVTRQGLGALGVDLNADHLAVAEIDRSGNPVRVWRVDLPLRGKSTEQAKALIGDAAAALAREAAASGKPLVLERLDFARRRAELEAVGRGAARGLSALAYGRIGASLRAACFRAGVEVIAVNPAFTSTIGAVNHAAPRGVSIHMGAAIAVARRGMGLSERPARAPEGRTHVRAASRDGTHVTLALPARNRARHVWAQWAAIRRGLQAAHRAPGRSAGDLSPAAPGPPARRDRRAICPVPARSRDANRGQNCSGHVMDDAIPWL